MTFDPLIAALSFCDDVTRNSLVELTTAGDLDLSEFGPQTPATTIRAAVNEAKARHAAAKARAAEPGLETE